MKYCTESNKRIASKIVKTISDILITIERLGGDVFKNMKIAINEQQPLDEVARELENKGYVLDNTYGKNFVYTNKDGTIDCFNTDTQQDWFQLTTLAELKEME